MDLSVKLEVFEGPLDLLLHLIDKNKINIYDIPIVLITEQYLSYVAAMEKQDMDVVSEFMVMAATLLEIKARMLLPREEQDETEEDPRQELVERLLEYRKFKYISGELRDMQVGSEKQLYHAESIPDAVAGYRPPLDLDELLRDVTAVRLRKLFEELMRRQDERTDHVRSRFGKIERQAVQIGDRLDYVRERICRAGGSHSFRSLLGENATKLEIVVTFLAVLELIRMGELFLSDDSTRDDIILSGAND